MGYELEDDREELVLELWFWEVLVDETEVEVADVCVGMGLVLGPEVDLVEGG